MPARSRGTRALFIAATFCLVLGGTMAADRVLGRLAPLAREGEGLLFAPYSRVLYETPEFTCLVSINGLGFRGDEFAVARTPGVRRILAIGDSFTYGWGVDGAAAWPAMLERALAR